MDSNKEGEEEEEEEEEEEACKGEKRGLKREMVWSNSYEGYNPQIMATKPSMNMLNSWRRDVFNINCCVMKDDGKYSKGFFKDQIQRGSKKACDFPWMSFSVLFQALRKKLPSSDIIALQQDFKEFQAKRMTRQKLIMIFRRVVGDKVLVDIIRKLQALQKYYSNVAI